MLAMQWIQFLNFCFLKGQTQEAILQQSSHLVGSSIQEFLPKVCDRDRLCIVSSKDWWWTPSCCLANIWYWITWHPLHPLLGRLLQHQILLHFSLLHERKKLVYFENVLANNTHFLHTISIDLYQKGLHFHSIKNNCM